MSTFPKLKTNSVCQYPAQRSTRFSTTVLTFLDGAEQRFRNYPAPLRSWTIDLNQLDDKEMVLLESFFLARNGQSGTFVFTDPWDQSIYPTCSFDGPDIILQYAGPQSGTLNLIVKENRV